MSHWLCSSLPFTVLGGSVREHRPPDQRGTGGDDKEALQYSGVTGHVGTAQASSRAIVHDGDAGTATGVDVGAGPAVLPYRQTAAG